MNKSRKLKNSRPSWCTNLRMLGLIGLLLLTPNRLLGDAATDVLKNYQNLSEKERQSKLVQGAKKEGSMVFYGTTAIDHLKRIFDEFNKRYPFIKIDNYRSGSANVYNKITTEARGNRYVVDVIDLEPDTVYGLAKSGLVASYFSPSRKEIMEEFMDKDGFWTAYYQLPVVLGYNTTKIKKAEAPKSYEDLLDPKWEGRFSLDTSDAQNMGTLLEYWGKERGIQYFEKLASNNPSLRRGKTLQAQIVASGEVDFAPWLYGYRVLQMKQTGAPLDVVLFKPTLSVPTYLLLAKNAPHPNSAALFIDWMLSPDGMRFLTEVLGRNVPRQGLKDKYPELNVPQYLVVDPKNLGTNYNEYLKLYCKIFKGC
ncbi:MAG TPA: extracellular solute-binding protein [Candidatus Binatia bacterium]